MPRPRTPLPGDNCAFFVPRIARGGAAPPRRVADPRPRRRRPGHHAVRPAHDHPRHDRGEHRAAAHPDRPALLRGQPVLGAERLHAHLRRPAAARRPGRRHPRPAPDVPGRHRPVHRRPRWPAAWPPRPGGCWRPAPCRASAARWPRPQCSPWSSEASRKAASGPARSASTRPWRWAAPRSAWSWAASSPSGRPGAGCCSSTCRSALAVLAVTPLFITESPRQPGRFDLTGAVTSIAGMTALVYAFIRAASDGWADRLTLAAFAVAVVMLAAFLLTESRARQPITPLRLFAGPARSGSYLARLLLVAGMFGMFFFLTQFVQDILGFSPLAAGFAFLPMTLTVFGVSRAAPRLLPRFGADPADAGGHAAGDRRDGVAGPGLGADQLPGGRPRADAAHRHRDGHRVRPAHHGVAGRGGARGLRRRLQHGERHAAGRRITRPGHPGHRVRDRLPRCGAAARPRRGPRERRPPAPHSRDVRGLHASLPSSTCACCWSSC